ncbi:MAG: hypothetical protein ACRDYV_18070 [Acidimicrobiia bacterium]
MASFLSIAIPLVAIICLTLALRRDPRVMNRSSSVRALPKSPLSRQVFKATRPPRPASDKPTAAPMTPSGEVAPFRRPRNRAG